jgi:SAM-dependent methyltransferase
MTNPFSDATVAAGYATARPPVHPRVIALLREWRCGAGVEIAADIGCGAGASTRALLDIADRCLGFDSSESMIRAARRGGSGARFVVASAEAMPLASRTVELLTAAGSLNYVAALDAVWTDARRVLTPDGTLAVYDFSTGRSFDDGSELDEWYEAFVTRYPFPKRRARHLSPDILCEVAAGFSVGRMEIFTMSLPMTCESYVSYVLTESNVHAAVSRGTPVDSVRSWCAATLSPVFAGRVQPISFRGYLACLSPT